MKVTVDPEACMGHALCNSVAPEVYELDADGFCVAPPADVAPGLQQQAGLGANACPERAITIGAGR